MVRTGTDTRHTRSRHAATAVMLAVVLALATSTRADTIVEYTTGGDVTGSYFMGQRFTTPAGDPYTLEKFTWLTTAGAPVAANASKLWILNDEYLGTPAALNSSMPTYVADSGTYGASEVGYYTFSSPPQLSASTNYWAYVSDDSVQNVGREVDVPTPNVRYYAFDSTSTYTKTGDGDESYNFRAEGSQVAPVPEPGTLVLFSAATLAGGLMARRRRKRGA